MAIIQIKNLSFTYEGGISPVFSNLDFHMDSSWRLGLVGRNGRGKTTLLRLMAGELKGEGQIISALPFDLFPYQADMDRPALEALIDTLHPYTVWEKQMETALLKGTAESVTRYGELEHEYALKDGYVIRDQFVKEAALMGFSEDLLKRPLSSFSPGEQTRLKLAALFLRKGHFLLIDEPTNHLDEAGRELVAEYLLTKIGFLTVSHDRDFLDAVCDHILALEKQGARVVSGNYSAYRENKKRQDEYERELRERILADVARLSVSAREKTNWSDQIESTKIGMGPTDRGYIGAKSAKMMKRAKVIERRIDKQLEEKEKLLKNLEYTSPLRITPMKSPHNTLVRFEEVTFSYDGSPLIDKLSFTLNQEQRLALTGGNGAGKTTLMKLILGELTPQSGRVFTPRGLVISMLRQTSKGVLGTPRQLALYRGLDLTLFFTLMRKFDLPQESFDREFEGFSLGQKKKTMLSLSLAQSAQLYLWDEPLNDIDPESRDQLEDLLLETGASMIFIEHERAFINKVATGELRLTGGQDEAMPG